MSFLDVLKNPKNRFCNVFHVFEGLWKSHYAGYSLDTFSPNEPLDESWNAFLVQEATNCVEPRSERSPVLIGSLSAYRSDRMLFAHNDAPPQAPKSIEMLGNVSSLGNFGELQTFETLFFSFCQQNLQNESLFAQSSQKKSERDLGRNSTHCCPNIFISVLDSFWAFNGHSEQRCL